MQSLRSNVRRFEVPAAVMSDINMRLAKKVKTDPRTKPPKHHQEFLDVFSQEDAARLSLLCTTGIDHGIQLGRLDGEIRLGRTQSSPDLMLGHLGYLDPRRQRR